MNLGRTHSVHSSCGDTDPSPPSALCCFISLRLCPCCSQYFSSHFASWLTPNQLSSTAQRLLPLLNLPTACLPCISQHTFLYVLTLLSACSKMPIRIQAWCQARGYRDKLSVVPGLKELTVSGSRSPMTNCNRIYRPHSLNVYTEQWGHEERVGRVTCGVGVEFHRMEKRGSSGRLRQYGGQEKQ